MKRMKKIAAGILAAAMAASLGGCGTQQSAASAATTAQTAQTAAASAAQTSAAETSSASSLAIDNSKWNFDETNNVYWQIGVSYCAAPQASDVETMGIYVPGAYMTGTKNSDGTYTCTANAAGTAGTYNAASAPIVIPVNTPGYAASAAPSEYNYSNVSSYLEAGFIYLQPGIRGRSSMGGTSSGDQSYSGGAPWGVTDLKAAIRYYRYNADSLPGNADSMFTFGMSGGGAQSALVGATGDSALYTPYLEAIGAAMTDAQGKTISDAVAGSMCWCPITSLDEADEAYEWNMGQFAGSGARADDSFGSALSEDLAAAYAEYLNALNLKDGSTALTLTQSDSGVYQSGTYYDYLLSVIETSLNNFLSDTTFPYTATASQQYPGGSNGTFGGGTMPAGGTTDGTMPALGSTDGTMPAGGMRGAAQSGTTASGETYETVQDYIDSLNSDTQWVTYDAATNTAKVSSVEAFVEHCKNATKSLGAFDEIDRGQGENNLFGNGQSQSLHFDAVLASLLVNNAEKYAQYSDWVSTYSADYQTDLAVTDSVGTSMQTRVDMYNPMYFLNSYYAGYQSSTVAKYWRIRTGIDQTDTALTVETNLALALKNFSGVESVDFATVWGMQHVEAERTGDSTTNFISWVNDCMA